ncbi:hypothetical protein CI610_00779 [invertebrate metagenome]|uniref:Uncharacterized protein n=1 Tax=invertebrate metagenome TaxID=1711999 RepID=A0A2H9TAJ2_9ZZZZ
MRPKIFLSVLLVFPYFQSTANELWKDLEGTWKIQLFQNTIITHYPHYYHYQYLRTRIRETKIYLSPDTEHSIISQHLTYGIYYTFLPMDEGITFMSHGFWLLPQELYQSEEQPLHHLLIECRHLYPQTDPKIAHTFRYTCFLSRSIRNNNFLWQDYPSGTQNSSIKIEAFPLPDINSYRKSGADDSKDIKQLIYIMSLNRNICLNHTEKVPHQKQSASGIQEHADRNNEHLTATTY